MDLERWLQATYQVDALADPLAYLEPSVNGAFSGMAPRYNEIGPRLAAADEDLLRAFRDAAGGDRED